MLADAQGLRDAAAQRQAILDTLMNRLEASSRDRAPCTHPNLQTPQAHIVCHSKYHMCGAGHKAGFFSVL